MCLRAVFLGLLTLGLSARAEAGICLKVDTERDNMGEQDRRAQTNPLQVVFDKDSGAIIACTVGKKGVQEWVVRKVVQNFKSCLPRKGPGA